MRKCSGLFYMHKDLGLTPSKAYAGTVTHECNPREETEGSEVQDHSWIQS